VLVVGCSHPGIDKIVEAASAINKRIHLIAGGFHLVVAKDPEIEEVVTGLRDTWKVDYVAPGHCTGEPTFAALRKAFGQHYVYAGLGSTIVLGPTPRSIATANQATASATDEDDLRSYRMLLSNGPDQEDTLVAYEHE
jgi:7,8-dihydropterin-6-yl-methyl-4-(beta-D-ribofuranosyl)aminobenzene 5'-phosphate synthase